MTLLASKIAEIVDEAIANNNVYVAWRGILNTQEWKVLLQRDAETNEFIVRAIRRDSGDGEPE